MSIRGKLLKAALVVTIGFLMIPLPSCDSASDGSKSAEREMLDLEKIILSEANKGNSELASALARLLPEDGNCRISSLSYSLFELSLKEEIDISPLTKSGNPGVRALAAETFGLLGGEQAREALFILLKDPDVRVREFAAGALAMLSTKEAEEIFLSREGIEQVFNDPALLAGMSRSRNKGITADITKYILQNWDDLYLRGEFIEALQIIRTLAREETRGHAGSGIEILYSDHLPSVEQIRKMGLFDSANAAEMIIKLIEMNRIPAGNTPPELSRALFQTLALLSQPKAINYLINKYNSHSRRRNSRELYRKSILETFRFHRYVALHGRDTQRIKALKILASLSRTSLYGEGYQLLQQIKASKILNPLVSNALRNSILTYEKNSDINKINLRE